MQENTQTLSRRDLMKAGVAASAAATVGIPITPVAAQAAAEADAGIRWQKGVCRFCGTGCGLQVGTLNGRVVATKGDPEAPVNRGLNCIKGYFNAKILYGKDRLTQPDAVNGALFDGFPRTIPQAEALQAAGIPIDFVLEIQVPDAEIVERMSGRRVDPVSGRTYHIKYNPPKVEGKDDVTGDPLIQRDDDREEVVRKRLDVYHSQTEALVGFYSDLAKSGDKTAPQYRAISGLGAIDAITARVFEALK